LLNELIPKKKDCALTLRLVSTEFKVYTTGFARAPMKKIDHQCASAAN
jgi:hypothetical protein